MKIRSSYSWKLIAAAGLLSCTSLMATPALAGQFEDALASTYETNPRLKAQRQQLEATNENYSQAISGWLPTISGSYSRGRQRNKLSPATQWGYSDSDSKGLTVAQPIFNGGETLARMSQADYQIMASREDLRDIEQRIMLAAITTYMDVVRDRSTVRLSENNEVVLQKQHQASKDRFAVGEVTRTDVAQAESRLALAKANTIRATGSLASSEATFERVIGYKPSAELDTPEQFPKLPTSLQEAIDIALHGHPQVLGNKLRQKAADEDVSISTARILPSVSLNGSMSRQEGAGFTGGSEIDTDSVSVNVNVPLYQSGAEYSRIRQAKKRASELLFTTAESRKSAQESATSSWENLATSIAAITSTKTAISAAEVALDGVTQEQLFGARTVLDVLDAEQELFSARVNLVQAERDRTVAIYTLLSSLGNLVVNDLGADVQEYDPKAHYKKVKYKLIGF